MTRLLLSIALAVFVLAGCSAAAPTPAPTAASTPAPSGVPTVAPTPSPTLIARGSFLNKGANVELDATGEGSDVDGFMTWTETSFSFRVELECARVAPDGLIVVGGEVTDSTTEDVPVGTRVAMVIRPGPPVQAHPDFENPDPPAATCLAYLESVTGERATHDLETIEGDIDLGS